MRSNQYVVDAMKYACEAISQAASLIKGSSRTPERGVLVQLAAAQKALQQALYAEDGPLCPYCNGPLMPDSDGEGKPLLRCATRHCGFEG